MIGAQYSEKKKNIHQHEFGIKATSSPGDEDGKQFHFFFNLTEISLRKA